MGKHRQRSMAYLFKHGSSLTTTQITPVLEGKARMQGPLDELLSADDFKHQKVCRDCRNSTESTQVQCCSFCGGEFHTFCLESSSNTNKRLCYSCQNTADPIGQREAIQDMEINKMVIEETNIVAVNDTNVPEKLAQDSVTKVDTNSYTAESTGCSVLDTNTKDTIGQFVDCKLIAYSKRLLDNAEDSKACINSEIVTMTEKENETDGQLKKYKMTGFPEGEPRILVCSNDRHINEQLSNSVQMETETNLQQFISEAKSLMIKSTENLDDPKNEDVIEEALTDGMKCHFSDSEMCKERQLEMIANSKVSMCFLMEDNETVERKLEAVTVEKSSNIEIKPSIGSQSTPGLPGRPLDILENDELNGALGDPENNHSAEQYMLNTMNKSISGTEQNITICVDIEKDHGSHSTVLNTNNVNIEKLSVENEIFKRASEEDIINQKDAEMLDNDVPAKEPFLHKMENLSFIKDFTQHSPTNSSLLLPSEFGGTCTPMTFEDSTLATKVEKPQSSNQILVDVESVGMEVAYSHSIFVGLDSDSVINTQSLLLENVDLKSSKLYLQDASSLSMSAPDTLHLKCNDVQEPETGNRESSEVLNQSFSQDMTVRDESLNKSVTILKSCLSNQDVAGEQAADIRQSAEVSDHSPPQKLEFPSAYPDASNISTCSRIYMSSEEPSTRQFKHNSSRKFSTEDEVKVCDICGDVGFEEMLAVCSECNEGAEHVYCMQTLTDQVPEGYWLCEGCKMKHKTSGPKRSELRAVKSISTQSPSISYSKKQCTLGNSRLRLAACLEKRKLGSGRKQLKGDSLLQGPSKRLAEDAFQATSRKQTEETVFAPVVKKQVTEISGMPGTSQASCSSTLRLGLSREGSFKNPDSGKVKFLSPSAVAGLNTTFHGTSSAVRGAGKPVVSNSSLSRTNSCQLLHQATNKSKFASLTSATSDSVTDGRLLPSSPATSSWIKNSLSKSSNSGAVHANPKLSFAGTKMSHKTLKEASEVVSQSRESLPGGQSACGSTRMLTKSDSFKSIKGAGTGFVSEKTSLPDIGIPLLQSVRTFTSEMACKSGGDRVDIRFSPPISELNAKPSPIAGGTSNDVQNVLPDGTTEPNDKVSTAANTDGSCSLQVAPLSDATSYLGLKTSRNAILSGSQDNSHPFLITSVAHLDCMNIHEADSAVPLQASPLKIGQDVLTAQPREISQQQRNDMVESDTGKVASSNENNSEQDKTHDKAEESGKMRILNKSISQQDKLPPQIIDLSQILSVEEGKKEIFSGAASSIGKVETSSTIKVEGLGSCQLDICNQDLTSEEKFPFTLDKLAAGEETKRNIIPVTRTSITSMPSNFRPSLSTRCYKCKELGHSVQSCPNRSHTSNSTPEYSLSNLQLLLSITPVDIHKHTMQMAAAQSKAESIPKQGNLKNVLEADVGCLSNMGNLQSQKPQIEAQCNGDKVEDSISLTAPNSIGSNHNELGPKSKSCLPFSEAHDFPRKSCEFIPPYFQPSSSLTVGISRDTSLVAQTMSFPRPSIPNYRPHGGIASVTQNTIGNISVIGNPTDYKVSQNKSISNHQFTPDSRYAARFSTPIPSTKFSIETALPKFAVSTSVPTSPSLINNGQYRWEPAVGISLHQVTPAAFTSPVAQQSSPQIGSITSPIAEPYYLWRGAFEVVSKVNGTNVFDGVQAHPSNRAVPKVHEFTKKLQSPLYLQELPRSSAWPLQFQNCPPTNENIALYFFAKDKESYERSYKPLVDQMLKDNFALRGFVEDAELLIFPSHLLPVNSQRWNQFIFLWAVFRDRKLSISCPVRHQTPSASRQSNTDAKMLQRIVAPLGQKWEEATNIEIQNSKEGKLLEKCKMVESSVAQHNLGNVVVPWIQPEVPTSQMACVQSGPSVNFQETSRMLQGRQQEHQYNQESLPREGPIEHRVDISSVDLQHSAHVPSQEDECKELSSQEDTCITLGSELANHRTTSVSKLVEEVFTLLSKPIEEHLAPVPSRKDEFNGFVISPDSRLVSHRTALLSKPPEQGGSHLHTTINIATNTEIKVACPDSFQAPLKRDHSKEEPPRDLRITCQPLPAALACPRPKKRQHDLSPAVDKLLCSKSRLPGLSRDRETGMRDYPHGNARGLETAASTRVCLIDRDKHRERRHRGRDRDWERERTREWDRDRERKKEHVWEGNEGREREREETLGTDYGRSREFDFMDQDHKCHWHKYPYFTSHSRSPPHWRSPSMWDISHDRCQNHQSSRSYSNSPESAQGSVHQQTPQQTESRGRSQDSHSQWVSLSADLVSNSRVEDEKRVNTKGTSEDLIEVQDSLRHANSLSKMKNGSKILKERLIQIVDLNVNPAECDLSETEGLNSLSSAVSCQPEQQTTYHTFFPTRQMELDEVEHGESSTTGKVLADQPHATGSLDPMEIEDSWNSGNVPTGRFYSGHPHFPSEVGRHVSCAKNEQRAQILTSFDLELGRTRVNSNLVTGVPIVLTLLQHQHNDDAIFINATRFSGGACNTAEHGNLELSLAFPNMTEVMQPAIGIDINKPASEEPVNTSLCLFGHDI